MSIFLGAKTAIDIGSLTVLFGDSQDKTNGDSLIGLLLFIGGSEMLVGIALIVVTTWGVHWKRSAQRATRHNYHMLFNRIALEGEAAQLEYRNNRRRHHDVRLHAYQLLEDGSYHRPKLANILMHIFNRYQCQFLECK